LHPEGCPSSAIAGVANGSKQVAAADRSALRVYVMSLASNKRMLTRK
jgi:hypothetical protein